MTRMPCPKERATRWRQRLTAGAMIASLWAAAAPAAEYGFSEGPTTATRTGSEWHGRHALPGVYCLRFPHPERARSFSEGFLNGNAISFVRVSYADRLATYVVTSTLPPGRTADVEFQRLQDMQRHDAEAAGGRYRVALSGNGFGPVIELQLDGVVEETPAGPFQLVRAQLQRVEGRPVSRSAHRLFVRGPDRFEVAVLGAADATSAADDGMALAQKVTAFADELLATLQDCTAKIPVRAGEPDDAR